MAFTRNGSSLIGTLQADTLAVTAALELAGITDINALESGDTVTIAPTLTGVSIRGGDGDDILNLGAASQAYVQGNADNDAINTGAISQTSIFGGGGDDVIVVAGLASSELRGGSGNDVLTIVGAVSGTNLINGNKDNDRIDARGVTTGGLTLSGGGGNDTIYGTNNSDSIKAGDGDDLLLGGRGNDTVLGDLGNDLIQFKLADFSNLDSVVGGDGIDTLQFTDTLALNSGVYNLSNVSQTEVLVLNAGSDRVTLPGGSGSDYFSSVFAGAGDDTITAEAYTSAQPVALIGEAGNDTLTGGGGNDLLDGGSGNDTLQGNGGNDTINGGDNDDFIRGDSGLDAISGGSGNDFISGGNQADELIGGSGADLFDFFGTTYSEKFIGAQPGNLNADKIADGTTFTFTNGVDVIRDFNVDDDAIAVTVSTTKYNLDGDDAASGDTFGASGVHYVIGNYDETTKVFTVATTGFDTLWTSAVSGDEIAANTGWVVIKGTFDTNINDVSFVNWL